MPPSIPFLRLPNVPQWLILEYLNLFQLFDFSLLSKRASEIAKSGKRNVKELHWNADYERVSLSLRITDYEDNVFKILISHSNRMNIEITFEGRRLRMARNEERRMSIGAEDQSDEQRFDKLTEHFLAMLNVENYSLSVIKAADLTKCFVWKYTKTLKELSVNRLFILDVLTAREMEFILGELTITEKLGIHSRLAEGFRWMEPLNTESIHLYDGRFLSLDVFLNSKVKEWRIGDRTLPTNHLNAIMKKWLDGGLEQLESFELDFLLFLSSDDEERTLNEALEGIPTFPWDRRTRKSWMIDRWKDTSEGRDMRRSDGKLATAGVDDGSFYFFVCKSDQLQPDSDSSDEDVEEDEN